PYQAHPTLRSEINNHQVNYIDEHLSQTGETLRQGVYGPIDYTIIEATKITENGELILSGSVGNTPIFVEKSKHIIIEINLNLQDGMCDLLESGVIKFVSTTALALTEKSYATLVE